MWNSSFSDIPYFLTAYQLSYSSTDSKELSVPKGSGDESAQSLLLGESCPVCQKKGR